MKKNKSTALTLGFMFFIMMSFYAYTFFIGGYLRSK